MTKRTVYHPATHHPATNPSAETEEFGAFAPLSW